ncbi:hypothetical protein [Qipengyuania zhejiangensis]|nr:hypothetical protein [Qipengyuania sp. Z2]
MSKQLNLSASISVILTAFFALAVSVGGTRAELPGHNEVGASLYSVSIGR